VSKIIAKFENEVLKQKDKASQTVTKDWRIGTQNIYQIFFEKVYKRKNVKRIFMLVFFLKLQQSFSNALKSIPNCSVVLACHWHIRLRKSLSEEYTTELV
jgi:hypothetical protein